MPRIGQLAPLALLFACQDYGLGVTADDLGVPLECDLGTIYPEDAPIVETCPQHEGSFDPVVEFGLGQGQSARSVPAVGDINGDGLPDIVSNFSSGILPGNKGKLVAFSGDGTELWINSSADLGYACSPSIGDVDGDGRPEIFAVRALGGQTPLLDLGEFAVVRFDHTGAEVWESDPFPPENFDYATGIALSDMDHDGEVEVVAGRVILRASDGSLRGQGQFGRGSWGELPNPFGAPVSEGTLPAVADLDLDGIEEVIAGNTMYTPDGEVKWHDAAQADGMVAVANLDDDPEGEFVVSSYDKIRAVDTDGSILWGPVGLPNANIVSPAAVADVDGDGSPEIFAAGGNALVAFRADGTELWSAQAIDESGATGPSVFDFESDGLLDVVYIDEQNMTVFDGMTGAIKFFNEEHNSDTMMDYPTIADVDADGQAEIIVAHANFTRALSVYGDANASWGPARRIWNQHAYSISNVDDDLSIPMHAEQGFTTHNTWHSAIDTRNLRGTLNELGVEILDVCEVDCPDDEFYVIGRVLNEGTETIPAGLPVSLYGIRGGGVPVLIGTIETRSDTPAGSTGEPFAFTFAASEATSSSALRLVVDDDGSGLGVHFECDETDNADEVQGPFCEGISR
ncbi:MAG: hypothetical protein EP330_07420 [Deltaproteobacteria bacterium]|nr:MAG: hypothetical protein EP330_07420 [Deltaproteobacteria bacterium]